MAALRVGSDMKVSGRNAVSADIVVGVSPGIAASTCNIRDTNLGLMETSGHTPSQGYF